MEQGSIVQIRNLLHRPVGVVLANVLLVTKQPELEALDRVGQGQSVFVSKHSTAIRKRGTNTMTNIVTTPTTTQPQTSKDVIARQLKLLIEQLEAGHSEGLTAYLTAMSRFHNYSFGNILEISRQQPDAPALQDSTRGTSLAARC